MFIQKHQKTGWCCPKTQPFWQRWINSRESNGILEGALQRFGGRPMTKRKPPSPGAGEETVLPGSGDRSNIYIHVYTHIYIILYIHIYYIYMYHMIECSLRIFLFSGWNIQVFLYTQGSLRAQWLQILYVLLCKVGHRLQPGRNAMVTVVLLLVVFRAVTDQ